MRYDSWNRILRMIYPDEEAVDYVYNEAGALDKIIGDEIYIQNIDYDKFGHRVQVELGNQNIERFTYTPEMQRLSEKQVFDANSNLLFDRSYSYDQLGNVTRYRGNAGVYQGSQDPAGVMGGNYEFNFTYDDQNRLQTANGLFDGEPSQQQFGNNFMSTFNLSMDYTSTGGIKEKNQEHVQDNAINNNNTYNNVYTYFDNTHKVKNITDQNSGLQTIFDYDLNGNMIFATDGQSFENNYYWDEENRLRVVKDINLMHHYIYDANGERVLKSSSNFISVEENGTVIGNETAFQNYTTYASPQIVIDANNNYTKHYFEADTRIVTRLGGDASLFQNPPTSPRPAPKDDSGTGGKDLDTEKLKDLQKSDLAHYFKKAEIESTPSFKPFKNNSVVTQNEEDDATEALEELLGLETFSEPQTNNQASAIFFYHADHLGSNEVISDETGAPHEFHLTLPFGETMVEQRKPMANYYNSWKFTGKELDEETGLYYFGARYYQPSWSIWLSVDPLAENYPLWNPYNYVLQNPVKLTDSTGMCPDDDPDCPENKNDPTIAIDPGHGIKGSNNPVMDPGAVANGYKESDLALSISKSVNSHLQSYGEETTMIREGELTVEGNSLTYRTNRAKEEGANIFISIHIDAAANENAKGFSVLYRNKGNTKDQNKDLAQSILDNQTIMSTRGIIERNNLSVLREFSSTGSAVLIEVGFITNESDASLMSTRASDIGGDIARGIYYYITGSMPSSPPVDSSLRGRN